MLLPGKFFTLYFVYLLYPHNRSANDFSFIVISLPKLILSLFKPFFKFATKRKRYAVTIKGNF